MLSKSTAKSVEPAVIDVDAIEEVKPTTVEADIINQVEEDVATESTPEEEVAKRITDVAIKEYWASKERQRLAPRAHQQDLSVYEKVLREFDVSGQYGVSSHCKNAMVLCALEMADVMYNWQPCTGIARSKRWKRAYGFDLDPPIEVLAVLLKGQDGDNKLALQRSHVDELLNTRTEIDT